MTTVQIPPNGVPAEFEFEIPGPGNLTTLGGVRLYFIFNLERPASGNFSVYLRMNDEPCDLMQSAMGPLSVTMVSQFQNSLNTPSQAKIIFNEDGTLRPGNTVTIYAWGAQTESGSGALNPDEGGEPSLTTETIEVGMVEVLTWEAWNRLTGGNQGGS